MLAAPPVHAQLRISILAAGESVDSGMSLPYHALPDTHVGRGSNDIAAAWLAEPTTRYEHGVLDGKLVPIISSKPAASAVSATTPSDRAHWVCRL